MLKFLRDSNEIQSLDESLKNGEMVRIETD